MQSMSPGNLPVDKLIEGIEKRVVTGDRLMLGRLHFPKGVKIPTHSHESEQITHVLSGGLRFVIGDR